jgi:hypothetical protein
MTSLDYDPNGSAAISYATFSEVKIAVKTGTAWSIETVQAEPTSGNVIGGLTSLRIASNGTAHIAYYEFPESLIGQGVGIPTGRVVYAQGLASNRPPVISGLSGTETAEGSPLSISFEVSDPEMSDVTLTAQGLPEGATLTGTTLVWTPGFAQSGTYEIIITASDGELETVQTVEVIVSDLNAPVMITESIPSAATIIAPAGDSRTFEVIPVDEDSDTPTYVWTLNGQLLEGETGPSTSILTTSGAQDLISVTVSDTETSVTRTWTIARALTSDFDGSGTVDFNDFLAFAPAFGQSVTGGADPELDLDGSGIVDFSDFLIFASFFGVSL